MDITDPMSAALFAVGKTLRKVFADFDNWAVSAYGQHNEEFCVYLHAGPLCVSGIGKTLGAAFDAAKRELAERLADAADELAAA